MNAHAGLLTGTAIGSAWTPEDAATIRELWGRKITRADIALMMGRTEQAIATYVKRHRADFPQRPNGRIPKPKPEKVPVKIARPRQPGLRDVRPDAEPARNPVRLIHLSDLTCRWPVEGQGQSTLFCGAKPDGRSSYCACHRARSVGLARVAG